MNTTPSPAIEAVELPEPVAHRLNTMEGFEHKPVWRYEDGPPRDSAFTLYPVFSKEQVLALLAAKQEEVDKMRGILGGVVELARDAHAHWDGDRDAKVGKLLLALAGHVPRYDPRADALHAALSPTQGEKS